MPSLLFKCNYTLHLQVVEMNPAEAMAANLARFHPYSLSPHFTGLFSKSKLFTSIFYFIFVNTKFGLCCPIR